MGAKFTKNLIRLPFTKSFQFSCSSILEIVGMVHFPICGIIPAFSGSFGNRDQAQIFFGFLRIEAAVPVEKEREKRAGTCLTSEQRGETWPL